jgi:translocation and assembly module TamA
VQRVSALILSALLLTAGFLLADIRPAHADIAYRVTFSTGGNSEVKNVLKAASQLVEQANRPPPTETALQRRVDEDTERLKQVLRDEGYYAAKLAARVDLAAKPAKIRIDVEPGPRYKLTSVALLDPDNRDLPIALSPKDIGLKLGQPARSAAVLEAERQITLRFAERGYPLARVPDRKVIVDHAQRAMSVTYTVDPGPLANFGKVRVSGTQKLSEQYIRNRVAWRPGDRFDLRKLEDTRKLLVRSELFDSVKIVPDSMVDQDGNVPISIEVIERKPRSISAGVTWSTSEGFGVNASWEHRNLAGHAERLTTTATLSQVLIGANAFLRLPDAIRPDLDIVASAGIEREDTEAFVANRITASTGVEQRFSSSLTGGLGVSLALEKEEENGGENKFTLIGLPAFLRYDSTNDPLDPTTGAKALAAVTPYEALFTQTDRFLRSETTGSTYLKFDQAARYILAVRGRLGSIWGAGREELPASVRFYAGGGGSVRGYGFQELGPLDEHNDPQGGRSVVEFGSELRVRLTDTIGIAPFIEGGNVYTESLPDVTSFDFRYGAGLGLRYYTAVGPLRFDVAFPLNRRHTDDPFQIYISLGQAF